MRFNLGPEGIEPVGIDSQMSLGEQLRRGSRGAEEAFKEAGLCDEEYIHQVVVGGFGVVKERRHKNRMRRQETPAADLGITHTGIVDAIWQAKYADIA